jgi:hypothetical protein
MPQPAGASGLLVAREALQYSFATRSIYSTRSSSLCTVQYRLTVQYVYSCTHAHVLAACSDRTAYGRAAVQPGACADVLVGRRGWFRDSEAVGSGAAAPRPPTSIIIGICSLRYRARAPQAWLARCHHGEAGRTRRPVTLSLWTGIWRAVSHGRSQQAKTAGR